MGTELACKYIKSNINRRGLLFLALMVFISILVSAPMAFGALDVTLAWDASSGAEGYRLFYREGGQAYNYSSPEWEGTATSGTVYGLKENTTYHFVVRAYNQYGESGDSNEETWTPASPNNPPVLDAIGSKSVNEGVLLSFTVTASDPDEDSLTFSASGLPSGASFDAGSQTFSWTPAFGDAGNYNVTFTVTDNGSPAESDSETVTITVGNVNRPPVLGIIGSKSVSEGNQLSFTVSASDPDGDGLTFSASSLPSGASFDAGSQTFSWTPALGDAGDYNVQFTVTDDGTPSKSDFEIITITVVEFVSSNQPPNKPLISSPYYGETETDTLLSVETEPFSDPDGDTHSMTQWQIIRKSDSKVVLEIMSSERLTELPIPHAVLDRETTYLAGVQFYDSYLEPSEWSDAVEFTTMIDTVDLDDDGIPDSSEVDATVDLNVDGTPDNDQPDVIKSAKSAVSGKKPLGICKITTDVDGIVVLKTIHPAEIRDNKNKPKNFKLGLTAYRLQVTQQGGTVQVRLYYSEDISGSKEYYIYDTINGWQDYTQYTTFNPDGRSVTVELQDGGHGDSDGVANGVIVDPGGVVGAATAGGLDSGVGGGCFIASAKPSERHDWLQTTVRLVLMPLVGISYILVRTSLASIILLAFILIVCVLSFYALIYRRRKYQI